MLGDDRRTREQAHYDALLRKAWAGVVLSSIGLSITTAALAITIFHLLLRWGFLHD